jgi:hypothetical protein
MTCSTAHAVPDVSCSECNNFGGGFRLGTICFFPRHFSDLAGIVWVLCLSKMNICWPIIYIGASFIEGQVNYIGCSSAFAQ